VPRVPEGFETKIDKVTGGIERPAPILRRPLMTDGS
jgi:hypothetical protein